MAKWADFLISGVWFSLFPHKHVSHVMLHTDNDSTVSSGTKKTRQDVVNLIKAGKLVHTIKWNYASASWSDGARVEIINIGGVDYLRTHKDATTSDNLDNSIDMSSFGI